MAAQLAPYRIVCDSRERSGWSFAADLKKSCLGSVTRALKTGDYAVEGHEMALVVERKATTAELARNLGEKRFYDELERLDAVGHPHLVCEFTLADLLAFPKGSGVPPYLWRRLRATGPSLLARLHALQLKYRTRVTFAGKDGKAFTHSLFRQYLRELS